MYLFWNEVEWDKKTLFWPYFFLRLNSETMNFYKSLRVSMGWLYQGRPDRFSYVRAC
ncbi:hypothetical protein CCP2SC5_140056 [Azospirillaceae bacterium]